MLPPSWISFSARKPKRPQPVRDVDKEIDELSIEWDRT